MSITKRRPPECMDYEKNRDQFTIEQLEPFDKQWVAFSMDCTRIIAAAPDLEVLERTLAAGANDPERVWLEFIDLSPDISPGGSQFG